MLTVQVRIFKFIMGEWSLQAEHTRTRGSGLHRRYPIL